MEYLTLPGDACFTPSEVQKLKGRISKLGFKVDEIRGGWVHYIHLKNVDAASAKASSF